MFLYSTFFSNLNIFNPNNPLYSILYFGLTELLHRLSALQEKFLVLNEVNILILLWLHSTLWHSFKRIINDLVPGTLFPDVIGINRLFHHIYLDDIRTFRQPYVGYTSNFVSLFWLPILSPIVVFCIAMVAGKHYLKIPGLGKHVSSFCNFLYFSYQCHTR